MTYKLGLTGSIGMGKSTTARMFADEGCALWDADAAVHRLYAAGGAAVVPIGQEFPDAIEDDAVSRSRLREIIEADATGLTRIETIVHPLVAADRAEFLDTTSSDIAVLDMPLLFETGADSQMDAVACVTIPADEQTRRVLSRGTMTRAQLEQIRTKQMPNAEKCARADFVIETDTLEHARSQVQDIVRRIRETLANA